MAIKSRGQIINQTDIIQLKVEFYNNLGELSDTDAFPNLRIIQPSGNVALGPTSAGVYRIDVGTYGFDYTTSVKSALGVWSDYWVGSVNGQIQIKEMNFVLHNTQMPFINSDGYVALGDDVGFNYSQDEIQNINKILKAVKARLNSSGKTLSYDSYGNKIYVDCDIFSTETLVNFIAMALAEFNSIPHFTTFTFLDQEIIDTFFYVFVQGAVIFALASQALIEKGAEYTVTDNGISFNPASLADLIQSQYNTELTNWTEKVRLIKGNMKPAPIGLGIATMTNGSGNLPIIKALSLLRARQIF